MLQSCECLPCRALALTQVLLLVQGYLLGGLCWFAVPFSMATAMGLGARALDLPITIAESNNGLVPPAMAVHLMGKGGAFLLVLQLFVAVVSTASAEQIAVSSLVAYDIYRAYFNKQATGKQIVFISRIVVVSYGVLSGVMAIILFKLTVSLGWVYLVSACCLPPVTTCCASPCSHAHSGSVLIVLIAHTRHTYAGHIA
jgi:Na+/proline symporter